MKAISKETLMEAICKMSLKIAFLKISAPYPRDQWVD